MMLNAFFAFTKSGIARCSAELPIFGHTCPSTLTHWQAKTARLHGDEFDMRFLRVYGRVLGLLGRDIRVAGFLAVANLIVAGLQFLDPVLFGHVVNLLTGAGSMTPDSLWSQAVMVLGIWAAVGVGGIVGNMTVSLLTER